MAIEPREMLGAALLDLCESTVRAGMTDDEACRVLYHALCVRLALRKDDDRMAKSLAMDLLRMVRKYREAAGGSVANSAVSVASSRVH
mgnify:FL=1